MRLRNIPGAREQVKEDTRCFGAGDDTRGKWEEIFGRKAPVMLEIGMGKGRFIIDMALRHPEYSFIGLERYESVMVKALGKLDRMERDGIPVPENLRFLCMDAANLEDMFERGEIDRIYLNFSDPWPKERHAKRRLESRGFLEIFGRVLKDKGIIEFKTDNEGLFDFALSELEDSGYELVYLSRDLHSDEEEMKDNVMTEYEEKFSAKGNKIFKYVIKKNPDRK
ncbi:MAG: tRNA (guanosine(46)-N7)-methyltransferase TrmB [Lachnospiraceae bacterium]|nr:tRNA (guanosine(46)-N7)-methyltransferase TrmB [Lachnospiraceae bacterium]